MKNINISYNEANTGLINNVKTGIKNIGFENITLNCTKGSGDYFGVIASNNGDVENLKFKNITVSANGMSYVGIIGGMSSGMIHNVNLEDITIEGKGYLGGLVGYININDEVKNITGKSININGTGNIVGGIVGHQSGNEIIIDNISLDNAQITGLDYTGGILANGYMGTLTNLKLSNSNITGGSYVGGIIGNTGSNENANSRQKLEVNSCIITGSRRNIGGIIGNINGGLNTDWIVKNTEMNANSTNVESIGGLAGSTSWFNVYRFQIIDTSIKSDGKNVGGATGIDSYRTALYNGNIVNTNISGNTNVGGLVGTAYWVNIHDIYLNVNVQAKNNSAGGVIGYMNNKNMTAVTNNIQIVRVMILDSSLSGPSKIGGLVGDIAAEIYREQSFYYNNYIEADVTSTNASTGSLIIGSRPDENDYIDNTYVYKYSKLNGNYVYATNDNIDDNQYLVRADLDNQSTFSSKIGLGTTYWNYASLSEGKYPKIKDGYLYKPELQIGVNLPVDPEIAEINMLGENDTEKDGNNKENNSIDEINPNAQNNLTAQNNMEANSIMTLPDYKVYPISVNEINIDFSGIDNEQQPEQNSNNPSSNLNFTYYVNGQGQETVELSNITNQTYTFKYNFTDTLEIELSNGKNEKTITITPEDVRSEASLTGGNNAYLLGTNLYINGELQQGEYVNIYEGKVLNSSGQVVDIATKQVIQSEDTDARVNVDNISEYNEDDNNNEKITTQETTYLEKTPQPLHTYEYKGNKIEVYGTYSKINGNIKTQIYNVRSGKLSALSNSLDMKIGNGITDNYNNKEYQTILNTSGELIDLKDQLQYPDNFLARNIKQIVQNTDEEKTEVMVLYDTGKAIVFNYVTGEIVYENNEKADNGLADYLAGSIENIWNDYEEKQQEYAKSKELETKLAELPIEKAMEQENGADSNNNSQRENENGVTTDLSNLTNETNTSTNSNNDYITVYNAETGKYEVYSEEEILKESDETPVSETEKITQNGLEGIYGYNVKEETKPQTNGAIIVIVTIAVAVIALGILRIVNMKNSTKGKK